ncbi:tetratricopeptide repeat protein [Paenibacillus senegalimassiliensis]|uniref:tetratricopeptide repeat protein n=1 Tax=Paenibacillus senegalimassiliensis TaxID=1737426 RepID=UPI00073F5511|nr:tetratricopeptide repeat protein [Paenibacillus senegalimassiliensis]
MRLNQLFKSLLANDNSENELFKRILNGSNEYIKIEKYANSKDVLIVFSHTNYPPGKFAMTNVASELAATKIYVNCHGNSWYQEGIRNITSSIDETAELLKEILAELKPGRIICTGMSMGGYAALLFGLLLEVDEILAFTSEVLIGEGYARSYYSNDIKKYDYRYKSLASLMRQNKKTQVYCIYGVYDLIDLSLLWSISDVITNNNLYHLTFASGNHQVTKRFDMSKLLKGFLEKRKFESSDERYCFENKDEPGIFMIYRELKLHVDEKNYQSVYELLIDCEYTANHSEFCLYLGIACLELKKITEAKEFFKSCITLDPYCDNGFLHLGNIYFSEKDYKKSIYYYQKGIEQNPDKPNGYYKIGVTYNTIRNTGKAIIWFKKALEKHPKYPEANFHLALLMIKDKNYTEAEIYIKNAIKGRPESKEFYLYQAIILIKQDRFEEALSLIQKTI